MKITIESTNQMVKVNSVPGRIWEGKTESGIYVQCVITRIAAPADEDNAQFRRELEETCPPQRDNIFPLRMVI